MLLMLVYPESKRHVYDFFRDDVTNNIIESFHKTFKAWYKTKKGLHCFESALDIISNFLFYYHFIHSHLSLFGQAPASVAGVT